MIVQHILSFGARADSADLRPAGRPDEYRASLTGICSDVPCIEIEVTIRLPAGAIWRDIDSRCLRVSGDFALGIEHDDCDFNEFARSREQRNETVRAALDTK